MCGRFNIIMDKQMEELLAELGAPVQLETAYNIAPTENIPVLFNSGQGLVWQMAKWWFTPSWSSNPASTKFSMFNAKSETLEESKAFRGSFKHKRCLIPASSFLEWKEEGGQKKPFEVSNLDGPLLLAGIYDQWQGRLFSTAIITQKAAAGFNAIHGRMPVFLTTGNATTWLSKNSSTQELKNYFSSSVPFSLQACEVGSEINNARNKAMPQRTGEILIL